MVKLSDIQAARQRIGATVFFSPCAHSETLSRLMGCELFLKLENLQMTGSFKDRGALNKILKLSNAGQTAGIIAASAGNHAQGVAHAARVLGIRAIIVMPETTPLAKIRGTRELGAQIVLHGGSYEEAFAKACELQERHGYTFIHAFDDPDVIAGQGTIGLEILEQTPRPDVVVVPVGGGGLIAGIATAVKEICPNVRIIGVQSMRLPAMKASLAAGKIQPLAPASTLADGIAVALVGKHTFPNVIRYVEDIITVSEEEIAHAIVVLLEREKTLAEGAGAVGMAALLNAKIKGIAGKRVVVIISGGNIDMNLLSRLIERGLERDGRLAILRVIVPDKPGSIAALAASVADQRANIFQISQSRPASEVQLGQTEVQLTLETRGWGHVEEILQAIKEAGFSVLPLPSETLHDAAASDPVIGADLG
jgi:threonine dehydratase